MEQIDFDKQRQRIKEVRNLMNALIKEAEYARDEAMNQAAKHQALISLYELRLQDVDEREEKLNSAEKASVCSDPDGEEQ